MYNSKDLKSLEVYRSNDRTARLSGKYDLSKIFEDITRLGVGGLSQQTNAVSTMISTQPESADYASQLKGTFPCFYLYETDGVSRKAEDVTDFGNFVGFDFDGVKKVEKLAELIETHAPPTLMYRTVSGKGLRVVYPTGLLKSFNHDDFKRNYTRLLEALLKIPGMSEFKANVDLGAGNVNRTWTMYHDANAVYNGFDGIRLDELAVGITESDFADSISVAFNKELKDGVKGNRHAARISAAYFAGGLVSGYSVNGQIMLEYLMKFSDSVADGNVTSESEKMSIRDCFKAGFEKPLMLKTSSDGVAGVINVDETYKSIHPYAEIMFDAKGKIVPSVGSLAALTLKVSGESGLYVRTDSFTGGITIDGEPIDDDGGALDRLVFRVSDYLPTSKKRDVVEAIRSIARINTTNSSLTWLNSLKWDNVDRFNEVYKHIPSCQGFEFSSKPEVVNSWFKNLFRSVILRTSNPGCVMDYIYVISGGAGTGKSRLIKTLTPPIFGEKSLATVRLKDFDNRRGAQSATRGASFAYIEEFEFTSTSIQSLKSIASGTFDSARVMYSSQNLAQPRTYVLIADTNDQKFIENPGSQRKIVPLVLNPKKALDGKVRINTEWFKENAHQLYSQVKAEYDACENHVDFYKTIFPDIEKIVEETIAAVKTVNSIIVKFEDTLVYNRMKSVSQWHIERIVSKYCRGKEVVAAQNTILEYLRDDNNGYVKVSNNVPKIPLSFPDNDRPYVRSFIVKNVKHTSGWKVPTSIRSQIRSEGLEDDL